MVFSNDIGWERNQRQQKHPRQMLAISIAMHMQTGFHLVWYDMSQNQ